MASMQKQSAPALDFYQRRAQAKAFAAALRPLEEPG